MTQKKLVDYIYKNTKINSRRIRDIKVFENYSFMTVPFKEAEIILDIFKQKTKGNRPIVEKAKNGK